MLSDAIVALATPPGRSALAVIRLSGHGVLQIAARMISGFQADTERIATLANFVAADGEPIDRGVYTVFLAPRSYTGEDMVELSCHGGLQVPTRLLAALQRLGARPASPGEFTRRAVLNGKLDLIQAEAVGDLIDATAPAQVRAAIRQLEGGLSRRIAALRESLIEIQALLSYNIDFPEEDDGPVSPGRIANRVDTVADQIRHMVTTAPAAERLREGALVVFAGRPNAGKSSLFNALLGTERALVTAIPGTTRDTVEADTDFLGWPVRLADTAGLWDAPSEIDRLGMEVSRRYLSAADLVLLCVESGRNPEADECAIMAEDRTLLVRTKSDLARAEGDGVPVSAMTGEGLGELRRAAAERVFGEAIRLADLEPALSRERHLAALVRARNALEQVIPQLGPQGDAVLASHHVREATSALDELLGVVDIEEVLDRVFASFCVGK
ncbi:MAG TPA: tRNA uridine-5-carboxymethylaminomethyl(34) synthesis GTPase MnmE [Gemmatimonadales bacterium]|nr:tRNA uridine-5-carboxymethylaminomethyl(34) synthesis GTPase MnmE [Gemmatimonadales bacterium]